MATLAQIRDKADLKIAQLIEIVELDKIVEGQYKYYPKQLDGDVEVLINTATDKDGNLGYYIAVFVEYQGEHYQKIIRKGADEEDSRDWFKAVMY